MRLKAQDQLHNRTLNILHQIHPTRLLTYDDSEKFVEITFEDLFLRFFEGGKLFCEELVVLLITELPLEDNVRFEEKFPLDVCNK